MEYRRCSTSSAVVTTSGSYSVTVTDAKGCVARDTISVHIIGVAPTVSFIFDTVCQGSATAFTGQASGSISSYLWNFGDANTSSQQIVSYNLGNYGTHNVSLTATSNAGCSQTVTRGVPVRQNSRVSFPVPDACLNNPYLFTNTSAAAPGDSILTFNWSFGDGATSSSVDPLHLYTTTGSKIVTLTATSLLGCSATHTDSLNVVSSRPLRRPRLRWLILLIILFLTKASQPFHGT